MISNLGRNSNGYSGCHYTNNIAKCGKCRIIKKVWDCPSDVVGLTVTSAVIWPVILPVFMGYLWSLNYKKDIEEDVDSELIELDPNYAIALGILEQGE